MKEHTKPLAIPLNEITVTIEDTEKGKVDYHETFLTNEDHFEYLGVKYNIPIEDTNHYNTSFWDVQRRLGGFFEMHKTLAGLLDWFNFRKRATVEIGFLYTKGVSDPVEIKAPDENVAVWSDINYDLQNNTTLEEADKDADRALKGKGEPAFNKMVIVALILVAVVAIVALYFFTHQSHQAVETVQNVTSTIPLPTVTP